MTSTEPIASLPRARGPFALDDERAYRCWRETKCNAYPTRIDQVIVEVSDPRNLTSAEVDELKRVCRKTNLVIYASRRNGDADKDMVHALADRIGLKRIVRNLLADDDGVTSLRVATDKSQRGYIPYSDRRLSWHTDGYYNAPSERIHAFILHCVAPAACGGDNALMDHEMAYMHLRDADPAHIQALMQPDVMTIPANTEPGREIRASVSGPVFAVDAGTGNLCMRYTARTRNIVWKDDPAVAAAVRTLEDLLAGASPYVFRHRFESGQGVLCNNVLHNRTAFSDDATGGGRLLYRARYYDRIPGHRRVGQH